MYHFTGVTLMFVGLGQAEKRILYLLQERGILCVADVLAAYPGVQPKSCRRAMRSLSSKGFGRLSETPVLTLAIDDKKPASVRKTEWTSRRAGETSNSRKFSPGRRGDAALPSERGPGSFFPRHKTVNGTMTASHSAVPQSCSPVEEPIDAGFRKISTNQESIILQRLAARSSGRTQLAHRSRVTGSV